MLLSEPNQATPLYVAICLGHLDIVRLVLEAAPHTAMLRCRAGRLALHAAAAGAQHPCSAAMVQLLLAAAPAAATVLADGGFAALHVAAAKANTGAARLLVEAAPAVLNMRAGPNHMTPLQVALVMAAAAEEAVHADWDEAEQFQPPSVYLETAQPMLAFVPPAVSLPLLAA